MLINTLIGLAVVLVIFVIVVSQRPADFQVVRSAAIPAPPSTVFAQVNDLRLWQKWAPWAKLDPDAKTTFEGPTSGAGAKFAWDGNSKIGSGRMTITESRPGELVRFKLEFLKPYADTNASEFTFESEGDQTVVKWSISGTNNFTAKAISLLVSNDRLVGCQFEQGLADLKSTCEAAAAK